MEPISIYHIQITEQHIREGMSKDEFIRISGGHTPTEPLELAFEDHFQQQANTVQYTGYEDGKHSTLGDDATEVKVFIDNPNSYFRDEMKKITIVADLSVIKWVSKFNKTNPPERAHNIPPITIEVRLNHETGEGNMAICEYSNRQKPIGF